MKRRSPISVHRSPRSGRLSQVRGQLLVLLSITHLHQADCAALDQTRTVVKRLSEPEREFRKPVCMRQEGMEARVGIEPTYKGFADLSLTTWVPRRPF
jgi:hypothetical protein